MKPNKIKIHKIKSNPNNPRLIKDVRFKKLVKSIKDFPEMLQLRPIVVDEKNIILGGNMRHKACIEAGLKEVYVIQADELTEEQKKEFIIKDNVGFGEWDWDLLANDWTNHNITEWGLDVWEHKDYDEENLKLDDFFNEEITENQTNNNKIILEYTQEDYDIVVAAFNKHNASKEEIVKMLLLNNIKI